MHNSLFLLVNLMTVAVSSVLFCPVEIYKGF
jgi:hypothetical protein